MKNLHLSIIIGIAGMTALGVASFTLIDLQSKNNESDKYVFEGNYEISKNMTGYVNGKSFFVSQSYPENYVNDAIQFHGVIFSILDSTNGNNPSGFVSNLVRFSDGIDETLTTGYGGHPPNTITVLTKHQNPQAGLTRYNNGSVNFLVNAVAVDLGITDLDVLHATTDNPLGIKAQVTFEQDTAISCIQKCDMPPSLHLVLSSEEGAQFVGYQACDGISCKKDNLDNSLYVHLEHVPQNYSGATGFEASHIYLGDLPWQVGDMVHVVVKAFPVALQPNGTVIKEQEKMMTVDLGELEITGSSVNASTAKNLIVDTANMTKENQTSVSATQIIPSCVSNITHQYANAGPMGAYPCPFPWYSASGTILDATGFYGVYNYTDYPDVQNYVLEPGHNGTLTYSILLRSINTDARIPEYPDGVNISNDIEFMHDANMHNHPGIDVSVYPQVEIIREHTNALVNITISASQNASHGTYWIHLPPGICMGGQIIVLTITDCPKK